MHCHYLALALAAAQYTVLAAGTSTFVQETVAQDRPAPVVAAPALHRSQSRTDLEAGDLQHRPHPASDSCVRIEPRPTWAKLAKQCITYCWRRGKPYVKIGACVLAMGALATMTYEVVVHNRPPTMPPSLHQANNYGDSPSLNVGYPPVYLQDPEPPAPDFPAVSTSTNYYSTGEQQQMWDQAWKECRADPTSWACHRFLPQSRKLKAFMEQQQHASVAKLPHRS